MKPNAPVHGAPDLPASNAAPNLSDKSARKRVLSAVCLLLAVGAGVYLFVFWRQWGGAGRRHYLRGMDYVAAKEFRKAEQEWLQGTREDPRAPQCFERLGELYQQLQRFDEAAKYYAAAAKLDVGNGELFLNLSRVQQALNKKQDALAAAQRAAELLPNNAQAQGQYGLLAARQYKRPEARAALQQARRLDPANTGYLFALVNVEMDQMDLAQAEKELGPFLKANPQNGEANYLMAVFNHQKPRSPENTALALTYARRAMPDMVRETRGYLLLGNLYLEAQNPQRALIVFTRGYQAHPEAEGMLRGLVDCYRRLGDTKNAIISADILQKESTRQDRIRHLEHVMGFNHFDTKSGMELARLEEEEGNTSKALVYYQQLLRQAPQDAAIRRALVACLQQAGQADLASKVAQPNFVP